MPAVLTHEASHEVTVPHSWKSVLLELQEFIELEANLCQVPPANKADAVNALNQLHERLLDESAKLLEPKSLSKLSRHTEVQLFARAVLMLLRLRECVAADLSECIDTVGLQSLALYEPDIPTCHRQLLLIREALERFPELSPPTLPRIEAEVEHDVDDANRKRKVVAALREEFDLDASEGARENVFRFFDTCYPETGLRPEEVDMILTGTMIFFCLPFKGTELRTERFADANDEDRQRTHAFLERVGKFAHWQFAHFPVFGFFRGHSLSPEMLSRLAGRAGLSIDDTAWELSRLIAIVPLDEADKFVVHDVWGHGWQASMLHFDRQYERLATFADAPEALSPVDLPNGEKLCWLDCFPITAGVAEFSNDQFESYIAHVVHRRLPTAMTPVIAEFLADVIESKLVNPGQVTDAIPNSSLLTDFPSKLDLMVQDLKFYFRQPTKSFRLWASRSPRQQRTIERLVQRGATYESAQSAVRKACVAWQNLESKWYCSTIRFEEQNDGLKINLFARLSLNILGLHRSTVYALQNAASMQIVDLPLQSLRDLMLMVTAVFFEAQPTKNLWSLDEFLALRVRPLCERLLDELREV